jgi:hypothetical protein
MSLPKVRSSFMRTVTETSGPTIDISTVTARSVAIFSLIQPAHTCSGEYWCKSGRNFKHQGHKNGFKTRRGSNFRPFSLESSRFYPAA